MSNVLGMKDVKGVLVDLLEKLVGDDFETWLKEIKKFLRKEPCWVATSPFPIWKTIRLGTGLKTADDFRAAIEDAGMSIDDLGNDILGKPAFTVSSEEVEINLVVVSNIDLGFKEGAKLEDTYARALNLGLELCPNEVGPQLRLQYADQPNGEWLLIAMDPIIDQRGNRKIFGVENCGDGERDLRGDYAYPDHVWDEGTRFVFRRRK
ncbi:MAG: hypothetical protein WAV98_03465 [Minisyncoccia bacterium]